MNNGEVPEEINEEEEPRVRRSVREKRRPDYYGVWINCVKSQRDPLTVMEALVSDDKEKWSTAMQKEINLLKDNQVWDLVELPKGKSSRKQIGFYEKDRRESQCELLQSPPFSSRIFTEIWKRL